MKKVYIQIAVIVLLILSALTVFYIAVEKKTQKIEKNIRKVETFNPTDAGGAFSSLGVDLFGGGTNELGGGVSETIDEDLENLKEKYSEKNELIELYNLPVASLSFLSDESIIFTDRANGYSFVKSSTESKNKKLNQNALSNVYAVSYSDEYILRTMLNEDFELEYDLEKMDDAQVQEKLSPEYKACKLLKENKLLCLKEAEGGYKFVLMDLNEKEPEEKVLYRTRFSSWDFWYQDGALYLLQKPSVKKNSYLLRVKNFKEELLDSGIGLVSIISDDSGWLLSSKYVSGKLKLFLKNLKNDTEAETLSVATFASKCAFVKDAIICALAKQDTTPPLLDDWLKGRVSSNDEFYKIDLKELYAEKMDIKYAEKLNFDVYKIKVAPSKRALLFINKINSKAWMLKIAQKQDKDSEQEGKTGTEEEQLNDEDKAEEETIDIKLKRDEI